MDARDSKSLSVTVRCHGKDAVGRMVAAARDFGARRGLSGRDVARLAIIIEELVTNMVEHGGVGDDGAVDLTLAPDDGAVLIRLADGGAAFDPRHVTPGRAIPERGGGAGIDLVRAWTDIVDYRSDGGTNLLTLRMPV